MHKLNLLKMSTHSLLVLGLTSAFMGCTSTGPDSSQSEVVERVPGTVSDQDTLSGEVGQMNRDMTAEPSSEAVNSAPTSGSTAGSAMTPPPSPSVGTEEAMREETTSTSGMTPYTSDTSTGTAGETVRTDTSTEGSETHAADNSARNEGSREWTAGDQGNSPQDIEVTRNIRRALTSNEALSTYAHNVKIITKDGAVHLKGPVRTSDEKSLIEETARRMAGASQVTSEITVTPR